MLARARDPTDDAAELLVIATSGDDVLDRLRAGEATSAVLLAATGLGLATTPLSQGFEIDADPAGDPDATVLHVPEHPQLLLRDRMAGADGSRAGAHPATGSAIGPVAALTVGCTTRQVLPHLLRDVVQGVQHVNCEVPRSLLVEFRMCPQHLRNQLHSLLVDGNVRAATTHDPFPSVAANPCGTSDQT